MPMLNLIQNLRIGTKLALASAFGLLLVIAMIASQIIGNSAVRQSNQAAMAQQELARDAIEAKLGARSMQLSARDIRLAGIAADLKKAGESLVERAKALNDIADAMLKLSHAEHNRARIQKLKGLS